ncbi:hypothetical protein [Streptosporangium sp. KLBMP 9127]|nr:hypothetical protein [Streptosporangium sp. KLBMP 9127]
MSEVAHTGAHTGAHTEAHTEPDQSQPQDRSQDRSQDLVQAVVKAVEGCPDVARLSPGPFGAVATYLPGIRISGVAVRDDEVEIAIVARHGRPLPAIADQVRQAVGPLLEGRPVNVTIDDVVTDVATEEATEERGRQ